MEYYTSSYMVKYLTLIEVIPLAQASKHTSRIVQNAIRMNLRDIYRLRRFFRQWRYTRNPIPQRRNSWSQRRYHPDERLIF